jgi:hypothetical protein
VSSAIVVDGMRETSNYLVYVGLTQTTILPFVGHFSPSWAKNDLQKKESTMLP